MWCPHPHASPISELKDWTRAFYNDLVRITTQLENQYKDKQDSSSPWKTQTLHAADTQRKAHRPGAVRVAVEMFEEGAHR